MSEEDVIKYLESLHCDNDIYCEKAAKYLDDVITAVKLLYDERDSLILMMDEQKASEITNHSELVKAELNKIQEDVKIKKQKFAKVSEA